MGSPAQSRVRDEHPKSQQSFAAKSFAAPWFWGWKLSEKTFQGDNEDISKICLEQNCSCQGSDKQFP